MTSQKKSPTPTKNFGAKFKRFFQKNYKIIFFLFIFFLLNCAFFAMACFNENINFSSKRFVLIFLFLIIVNILLCVFIFYVRRKNWKIENIFLVVGSALGLIYTFAIPMGRAPDEPAHIWRVYSISQGNILTETQNETSGSFLPQNIANFGSNYDENAYEKLASLISEQPSDEYVFHNTIGSNPIDYLPQVIGTLLGRVLHLPFIVILYLARLCGLASCIIITYFCIKYIPILKKTLFFIACLPLTMQTFISISYDGMIFCMAIAIITFTLFSMYNTKFNFKPIHYLILTLLNISLIAVKPVYFPLCLLLFFIPTKCFKNKKRKILSLSSIFFITIIIFILWSMLSIVTEPGNGADTGGQVSFILSNPIKYIAILIRNILDTPFIYLQRFGALEWLNVHINNFYIIGVLIVFIILCIDERSDPKQAKIPTSFRLTTLSATTITTILIFSALYIQWTEVGSINIEGVQTRYFLPILITAPLFSPSSAPYRRKISSSTHPNSLIPNIYLYFFIIFLNLNAFSILLCTHI